MMILECRECGYERSSEEDGQQFHKVCSICYTEDCDTSAGQVWLCNDCFNHPDNQLLMDENESLFT